MADDALNQELFAEDVAAAAAAGGENGFAGANVGTDGNFEMPSVDEIWKMVQQMEDISDAEKEDIRENLFNPQRQSADEFLKQMGHAAVGHSNMEYMTFIIMISILFVVFALFGFKLYKSLTEKELKKQEKLKSKQQKKLKKSN